MGCTASAAATPYQAGSASPLSPEEVAVRKDQVVQWRKSIKRAISKSLLDTSISDCFCSIVEEPWKMQGETYVMDVFEYFKKRRSEINIAFKGGIFVEGELKYDYGRTVILQLVSRNSSKTISAILCVEHDTNGGKVWEVIWFGTRERKQNKGYGASLFQIAQNVAARSGVNGILVTATNEVVVWWMTCTAGKDGGPAKVVPEIIRGDGSTGKITAATPKRYGKKLKKLPKGFCAVKSPPASVSKFYPTSGGSTFKGTPYRYDVQHTTHIWWKLGVDGGGTKRPGRS